MKTQHKKPATGAKKGARTLAYPVEFRLRIVKLFLDEGYSAGLLCEQFGISSHSIHRWVRAYRLKGAEGLEPKRSVGRKSRVADEVRQQAAEISTRAGKQFITPVAWRVAAKQWLVTNGLIRIQKAGEVSPNFL